MCTSLDSGNKDKLVIAMQFWKHAQNMVVRLEHLVLCAMASDSWLDPYLVGKLKPLSRWFDAFVNEHWIAPLIYQQRVYLID